ncbi:Uncharacterised protein [uncultured archaeon]|nr:Uncharacterised protein [uncultured archaeon]
MAHGETVPDMVKKIVKNPLGKVYSQSGILAMLRRQRIGRGRIIAVGDATGSFLVSRRIWPKVWIYDGKEYRKRVDYTLPIPTHIVSNPKGRITHSMRAAIDDALKSRSRSRIYVQGEEDMAALYAIAVAKGNLVLYGQPKKGIVAVRVGAKEQKGAESLICMLR